MAIRAPGPRSTQTGSYTELDDRLLVLDFQAGQVEAFVEIHHRYAGLARHVCGRFLKNHQDVDEALQETWIRVFQGLHRFNGRYALGSWISRIATNVALDVLRARSRRPQLDDQPLDAHEREDAADGPEEQVERLIERDVVIGVLAALPDTHRQALVLRELEGRSHKEIAAELDITPAQAKALIHRAKGTFRREWLRAETERHGLAGFFLLPVIWLSKLGGIARKVADRTAEAVHAGGSEVATHAAQAAVPVAPVAVGAASTVGQMGERIVAAGLTLLVAGGVTVGAATIARDRGERDKPEAFLAAPVRTPAEDPAPAEPVVVEEKAEKEAKGLRQEEAPEDRPEPDIVPAVVESPSPTESPGPMESPAPTESPSPSGDPSPTATPSPEPTPFVPPPWSLSFITDVPSDESCRCSAAYLISSEVSGTPTGGVSFAQVVRGGALDAEGDVAWGLLLQFWGEVGHTGGSFGTEFTLGGLESVLRYEGFGKLVETTQGPNGEFHYRFSGSYRLSDVPPEQARLPSQGELSFVLAFAPDGTLFSGEFRLFDQG